MPGCRAKLRASGGAATAPPRLLDVVIAALRARHYSPRTEKAYIGWIRRFILFHGKRHPREMAEPEIGAFLSALATGEKVAAGYAKLPPRARVHFMTHVVRRGERLTRIAAHYNLPVSEIRAANPRVNGSRAR